jgi:histone deacetylase complex subunit SAP18
VYLQTSSHHSASSFAVRGEEPNADSIVIYTWPDATLRELAELIQLVNADARRPNSEISFAFVYPDRTGTNTIKHVQTIQSFRTNKSPQAIAAQRSGSQDDQKTLKGLKFETGDFLSVALLD